MQSFVLFSPIFRTNVVLGVTRAPPSPVSLPPSAPSARPAESGTSRRWLPRWAGAALSRPGGREREAAAPAESWAVSSLPPALTPDRACGPPAPGGRAGRGQVRREPQVSRAPPRPPRAGAGGRGQLLVSLGRQLSGLALCRGVAAAETAAPAHACSHPLLSAFPFPETRAPLCAGGPARGACARETRDGRRAATPGARTRAVTGGRTYRAAGAGSGGRLSDAPE